MGTDYAPPNSYIEAPPPSVTALRDRASKEVVKVKWGPVGGPRIPGLVPLREEETHSALHSQGTRKATCHPGRGCRPALLTRGLGVQHRGEGSERCWPSGQPDSSAD